MSSISRSFLVVYLIDHNAHDNCLKQGLYYAGLFLTHAGRQEKAREYVDRLLKINPSSRDGLILKGWIEVLGIRENKGAKNAVGYFESVPKYVKPTSLYIFMSPQNRFFEDVIHSEQSKVLPLWPFFFSLAFLKCVEGRWRVDGPGQVLRTVPSLRKGVGMPEPSGGRLSVVLASSGGEDKAWAGSRRLGPSPGHG